MATRTEKINIDLYNGEESVTFYPKSHRYKVNGEWLKSVTQIVGIIDKPGLKYWSVDCMRKYMEQEIGQSGGRKYSSKEMLEMVQVASKEWERVVDEACDIGGMVHDWVEDFAAHGTTTIDPSSPKEVRQGIKAFLKWYNANDVKFLETERLIYSREYGYVGRFDCIAEVNGKKTLIDWKTSKDLYSSQLYQVAGYALAYQEEMGEVLDQMCVIQFQKQNNEKTGRKAGSFKTFTVDLNLYKSLRATFISCLHVLNAEREMQKLLKQ